LSARWRRAGAAAAALAALLLIAAPAGAVTRTWAVTEWPSAGTSAPTAGAVSDAPVVSRTGRYVVFRSSASNLVKGDTNGVPDVFLRDRLTRKLERVSVATGGAQAGGASGAPSVSADGRFVAFESSASNLIKGDANGRVDVFLRDRRTGRTTLVSRRADGGLTGQPGYQPSVSADGRYVAWATVGAMTPDDTNGVFDVYRRDLTRGATERVSVPRPGAMGNGASEHPVLSGDGTQVAFTSTASDLIWGDGNGHRDAFVRAMPGALTSLVSISSAGIQGDGAVRGTVISADAATVAFTSEATNLVPGDTNRQPDVFVRERASGTTRLVSAGLGGRPADAASMTPAVSDDGRMVLFVSGARNLVEGDTDTPDAFVRDLQRATTEKASQARDGSSANSVVRDAALSGNGRYVAIATTSSNLVGTATGVRPEILLAGPQVPFNTDLPSVTGTAIVRETLGADQGSWDNEPTGWAYQWQRCNADGEACRDIAKATASGYVPAQRDLGATLRVRVTAINAAGPSTATSTATSPVVPPPS
jgi:Tol biopolymer transport system component